MEIQREPQSLDLSWLEDEDEKEESLHGKDPWKEARIPSVDDEVNSDNIHDDDFLERKFGVFTDMGFDPDEVGAAMYECGDNQELALEYLLGQKVSKFGCS